MTGDRRIDAQKQQELEQLDEIPSPFPEKYFDRVPDRVASPNRFVASPKSTIPDSGFGSGPGSNSSVGYNNGYIEPPQVPRGLVRNKSNASSIYSVATETLPLQRERERSRERSRAIPNGYSPPLVPVPPIPTELSYASSGQAMRSIASPPVANYGQVSTIEPLPARGYSVSRIDRETERGRARVVEKGKTTAGAGDFGTRGTFDEGGVPVAYRGSEGLTKGEVVGILYEGSDGRARSRGRSRGGAGRY